MILLFKPFMADEVDVELSKVLHSGYIGQGPKVDEFEEDLKKVFQSDYVVTVNSATSGLQLAIHMVKEDWGVVLSTPLTCTATNFPILAEDLFIQWVDVDKANLNMDLDDLARKIDKNTRLIVLVHWGGVPIDYDKLEDILSSAYRKFGFRPTIVEDCAHAMGAEWNNFPISKRGLSAGKHIQVYSFQAIKHITSVDGGAIVFPNEELYKRAKLLRWYGIDRESNKKDMRCESDIKEWGFKFHMNDVNATVGIENLKYLKDMMVHIRTIASIYDNGLLLVDEVIPQSIPDKANPAFWLYTILVEERDKFAKYMTENDIMVSKVHERNDNHSCLDNYKALLPNLDYVADKMICIPIGWWVTENDAHYIIDTIRKFYCGVE